MKIRSIAMLSLVSLGIPLAAQSQNPRNPGRNADKPANFERVLERFDANQNGSLSKDEVGRRLAENFEAIDADGDGEITRREMRALRQARMNRKGPTE